eukprot:2709773-Prymnesium_polylepis.2
MAANDHAVVALLGRRILLCGPGSNPEPGAHPHIHAVALQHTRAALCQPFDHQLVPHLAALHACVQLSVCQVCRRWARCLVNVATHTEPPEVFDLLRLLDVQQRVRALRIVVTGAPWVEVRSFELVYVFLQLVGHLVQTELPTATRPEAK